ncbi:MAG: hypothetical protein V4519_05265 [Patescibacteria group bacterium]
MVKKLALGGVATLLVAVAFASVSQAAMTTVVTPSNTQGWATADTRPGGTVNFVVDPTSPFPDGALQLTTDDTNAAKAQYLHAATGTLASVTDLSYYTKQVAGPAVAAPSYQLAVDLNGAAEGGFANLVYEPYWNGTVVPGTWQQWDVDAGQFWSSKTFTEGTCSTTNGAGGPPFYTLEALKTACPDAVVLGFGVNVGTYNPGYNVYTDGVVFNDTTYNFEVNVVIEDVDTTAPAVPMHVSPLNGATTTTASLLKVDWTDVTDASSSPVTYFYESSYASTTNPDGSFTAPVYVSGPLAASEIATPGTPEGTYYWHVRAVDSATVPNSSAWSDAWSFTVNNTVTPPAPTGPTNKDQCKNDGWKTFTNPTFKNQGQCVSSVANGSATTTPATI